MIHKLNDQEHERLLSELMMDKLIAIEEYVSVIPDLSMRVSRLEYRMDGVETGLHGTQLAIRDMSGDIVDLKAGVEQNSTDILGLTAAVGQNTRDILKNSKKLDILDEKVDKNSAGIVILTAKVDHNSSQIALLVPV